MDRAQNPPERDQAESGPQPTDAPPGAIISADTQRAGAALGTCRCQICSLPIGSSLPITMASRSRGNTGQFPDQDQAGFREANGYPMRGDPWQEERHSW